MAFTLADQYYLKAFEGYGYSFEETIENLNYAMSYDPNHAGANYLMGRLYMEEFKKYDEAESYLLTALRAEPDNIEACKSYINLLIDIKNFNEALRVIKYSTGIKGADIANFLFLEGLVYECKKDFSKAILLVKEAMLESINTSFIDFLSDELKRIERKKEVSTSIQYEFVS